MDTEIDTRHLRQSAGKRSLIDDFIKDWTCYMGQKILKIEQYLLHNAKKTINDRLATPSTRFIDGIR